MATALREQLARDTAADLLGGSEAVFNEARTHRYLLIRRWAAGKRCVFIMLNPSVASAVAEDPTMTRVQRFARRGGYSAVAVVNLFGLVATDPRELARHPDPVGLRNDEFLTGQCQPGWPVIAAWGVLGSFGGRAAVVARMLQDAGVELLCLGTTAAGHPRHPLYLPANAPLVPYEPGTGP